MPSRLMPKYAEKYQPGFEYIGMISEQFAGAYSVPLRVRPTALRGH
jgi:hypothetical protein